MTHQNSRDDMLPFYEEENTAIHRRDPQGAQAACVGRSRRMAEMMLAELFRRRVFTPPESAEIEIPDPLRVPATADAVLAEPSIAL